MILNIFSELPSDSLLHKVPPMFIFNFKKVQLRGYNAIAASFPAMFSASLGTVDPLSCLCRLLKV